MGELALYAPPVLALAAIALWLRQRGVPYGSLIGLIVTLVLLPIPEALDETRADKLRFLLSPTVSYVVVWAALRLSRVRDLARRSRGWRRTVGATRLAVAAICLGSFILWLMGQSNFEEFRRGNSGRIWGGVELLHSTASLSILLLATSYSLHKYGSIQLVVLASSVVGLLIARQYVAYWHGGLEDASWWPHWLTVSSDLCLGTVFISLATAWALSETADLSLHEDSADRRTVLAVTAKRLGNSTVVGESGDREAVRSLNQLRTSLLDACSSAPGSAPTAIRFTGDGYILVWEIPPDRDQQALAAGLIRSLRFPPSLKNVAIGLATGDALRILNETGRRDYIGVAVDRAGELASMVLGPGGLAVDLRTFEMLAPDQRDGFFVRNASKACLSWSGPCRVTIGHGHAQAWRELETWLKKEGVEVQEFEMRREAGQAPDQRLEELAETDFAIVVLTAEDVLETGEVHPRPNVIHEVGFFQGKLGAHLTLALYEEGCVLPSNLAGQRHVSFSEELDANAIAKVREVLARAGIFSAEALPQPPPPGPLPAPGQVDAPQTRP